MSGDAVVVDVGGGVGTSAIKIVSTFPAIKAIVQDRPEVMEQGLKVRTHPLSPQYLFPHANDSNSL